MKQYDLNDLSSRAYKIACEHGFHEQELSNEHFLTLVISELCEAVEADRTNHPSRSKLFKRRLINSATYNGSDKEASDKIFCSLYEIDIKGSIDEELADAFIRLLDLFGLRNIFLDESKFDEEHIQEYAKIYKYKSFTEGVYYIIGELASPKHSITESCVLPEMLLLEILGFARHLGIDLIWHITTKMQYNELRPYKHGKMY